MSFKEITVLVTEIRNAGKKLLHYITEYPLICESKLCVTGQPVFKSLPTKNWVYSIENTILLAQFSHSFPLTSGAF